MEKPRPKRKVKRLKALLSTANPRTRFQSRSAALHVSSGGAPRFQTAYARSTPKSANPRMTSSSTSRSPGRTGSRDGVGSRPAALSAVTSSKRELLPSRVSEVDDDLEAAVEHPLRVEGHRRIHHLRDLRVLHHPGVHGVAVRFRLVDDPREDRHLAGLRSGGLRESDPHSFLHPEVVAHGLAILQGSVFLPRLARDLRHAAVSGHFLPRDRQQESIDITRHEKPPRAPFYTRSPRGRRASRGSPPGVAAFENARDDFVTTDCARHEAGRAFRLQTPLATAVG